MYNGEGKTLAEIGTIYGVTRERVRQVMKKLQVLYTRKRTSKCKKRSKYTDLQNFLDNHPLNRLNPRVLEKFLDKQICEMCGSHEHLAFHHLCYPAMSRSDLKILCASCHKTVHTNKITKEQRHEIYQAHQQGETCKELASRYHVAVITVGKICGAERWRQRTYRR